MGKHENGIIKIYCKTPVVANISQVNAFFWIHLFNN